MERLINRAFSPTHLQQLLQVLFLGVIFALFISGPIRTLSGLSLSAALALSLLLVFIISLFFFRRSHTNLLHLSSFSYLLFAFWTAQFFLCMYSPAYEGLVSTGGGDAADHVYYRLKFVQTSPQIYHGFSTFFSFSYYLEQLFHFDVFSSFRFIFYFLGCSIFFCIAIVSEKVMLELSIVSLRQRTTWILLLAALSYFPFTHLLLPAMSYLQAEGFFPQLFGLFPLFCGLTAYCAASSSAKRMLILFTTLAAYRFTYGLNLFDLCATVFILVDIEFRILKKSFHLRLLTGFAGLALSIAILQRLYPLVSLEGAILPLHLPFAVFGCFLTACICLNAVASSYVDSPILLRFFRFCGCFGIWSAIIGCVWLISGAPQSYYLHKYIFHSMFLLVPALVLLCAYCIYQMSKQRLILSFSRKGVLFCTCSLCALFFLKFGFEILRPHFEERRLSKVPGEILQPFADTQAIREIEKVLDVEKKLFGGFIATPSWAASGFTNAALNYYHYRRPRLHTSGRLRDEPGYCIFWNSNLDDFQAFIQKADPDVLSYIKAREADPLSKHLEYQVGWKHNASRLSYRCF